MYFDRSPSRPPEINLIPLANIIFWLLVFFIIGGTIEKFDVVPIEPPFADSGKRVDEGSIIVVFGAHEELLIDDEMVDADAFSEAMREKIKSTPNAVITVKADARLKAQKLIKLMEDIKRAGGKNLSLMTQSFS